VPFLAQSTKSQRHFYVVARNLADVGPCHTILLCFIFVQWASGDAVFFLTENLPTGPPPDFIFAHLGRRAAFRILLYLPEFQNHDLGGGVPSVNLSYHPLTSNLTGLTRSILVSHSRDRVLFQPSFLVLETVNTPDLLLSSRLNSLEGEKDFLWRLNLPGGYLFPGCTEDFQSHLAYSRSRRVGLF